MIFRQNNLCATNFIKVKFDDLFRQKLEIFDCKILSSLFF